MHTVVAIFQMEMTKGTTQLIVDAIFSLIFLSTINYGTD